MDIFADIPPLPLFFPFFVLREIKSPFAGFFCFFNTIGRTRSLPSVTVPLCGGLLSLTHSYPQLQAASRTDSEVSLFPKKKPKDLTPHSPGSMSFPREATPLLFFSPKPICIRNRAAGLSSQGFSSATEKSLSAA